MSLAAISFRCRAGALRQAAGLAPVDGTDVLGPTASLNSVAKLEQERFGNGINIKFDAHTVAGEAGRTVLEALLRGYFRQGGMQVLLDVLDPKVLEEAMADPNSHRNLLVRISGCSAYFVDLTPQMQQEIIDRSRQKAGQLGTRPIPFPPRGWS